MNNKTWLEKNTARLDKKKIAITGSTGGLGVELCKYLASLGADLVLVDRNAERSEEHARRLRSEYPDICVLCVHADLEDILSVHEATEELKKADIDIFIHNAGAYSIERHICTSGYENIFQINFASPYYMIRELVPYLRKKNGKAVAVGSIAHNYSKSDGDDIDFRTRRAHSKVYGNAKRYLMFSLYELFAGEENVSLSVVHPGITFTNITNHYPKVVFALIKHPMKIIFMKPKTAALSLLLGIFDRTESCEWIGPCMFGIWGYPKKKKLHTCSDAERAEIAQRSDRVYNSLKNTIGKLRTKE